MSKDFISLPPQRHREILEEYLPRPSSPSSKSSKLGPEHGGNRIGTQSNTRPFLTLTFAQSLDSRIAAAPGERTPLSGKESKAMTHYLRGKHDAVIVGGKTAKADDPGLNCRILGAEPCKNEHAKNHNYVVKEREGEVSIDQKQAFLETKEMKLKQPRPIVLDRHAIFDINPMNKLVQLALSSSGKPPWILCNNHIPEEISSTREQTLRECGGELIRCNPEDLQDFSRVLTVLGNAGIKSVMLEGGANVIESILARFPELVDTVILTIAPVWLGRRGLEVTPKEQLNLSDVNWISMGRDTVMCARVNKHEHPT